MLALLPSFAMVLAAGENYFLQIWVVSFVNNTYDLHAESQQTVDIGLPSRISESLRRHHLLKDQACEIIWYSLIFFCTGTDKRLFQPVFSFCQWPVKYTNWPSLWWVPYNILLASSSQMWTRLYSQLFNHEFVYLPFELFFAFSFMPLTSTSLYGNVVLHFNCMLDENYSLIFIFF